MSTDDAQAGSRSGAVATDTTRGTLGAILPYFGCKRTLAPRIVQELGPHAGYVEPFCGSCAVIMAKAPAGHEHCNDAFGLVINLARVLAHGDAVVRLYRRVDATLMHQEIFEEAKSRFQHDDVPAGSVATSVAEVGPEHEDLAYWFLVLSWQGRHGTAGTAAYNHNCAIRYTLNGGSTAKRWQRVAESIPAWHRRLKHVLWSNIDGIELCRRIEDSSRIVLYIDPPYLEKSSSYVHDFSDDQHAELAEVLRSKRACRAVVSYYDDPRLAELYPGWTRVELPITNGIVNAGARGERDGRAVAPEVLLINGPSCTGGGLFSGGGR